MWRVRRPRVFPRADIHPVVGVRAFPGHLARLVIERIVRSRSPVVHLKSIDDGKLLLLPIREVQDIGADPGAYGNLTVVRGVQEMERRGANIVNEEQTEQGDVVLKLRRWE